MDLKDKAIRVIEAIVSDDDCERAEYNLSMRGELPDKETMKRIIQKTILIYEIAHSAIEAHSCYDVHTGWREQTEELYNKYKEEGLVP